MVWYSYLLKNFPQFIVIHTVKGFVADCDEPHRSAAKRSYPTSEVRGGGGDELSHAQGQGWKPRGAYMVLYC